MTDAERIRRLEDRIEELEERCEGLHSLICTHQWQVVDGYLCRILLPEDNRSYYVAVCPRLHANAVGFTHRETISNLRLAMHDMLDLRRAHSWTVPLPDVR